MLNARHAVGNGDGCQAATATVFTIRFISTNCMLNGRKVEMKILWIEKRMKI